MAKRGISLTYLNLKKVKLSGDKSQRYRKKWVTECLTMINVVNFGTVITQMSKLDPITV